MYDYQISSQVGAAHRQDLIIEARARRLRRVDRTVSTPTRPGRRLISRGFRRLSVA